MVERGFYIIDDAFFIDFPDPFLKGNKKENRPHYYCFQAKNGLFWVIPTSENHIKYQSIISKRKSQKKPTDFLYIAKLDNGKTNAFLIGDMFPVTERYVKREYTFGNNHLTITSATISRQIEKQARLILGLIRRGHKFSPTQPDVLKIEKILLTELENDK